MSLFSVSGARGEGSSGSPGMGATELVDDGTDPNDYNERGHQNGARGTVIPHRVSDDGRSPAFDPNGGLEQFTVIDMDTAPGAPSEVVAHVGKPSNSTTTPLTKEAACLTQTPPPISQLSTPISLPLSAKRSKSSPQTKLLEELTKRVNELSSQFSTVATQAPNTSIPVEIAQQLATMQQQLASLTSTLAPLPTPKTPSPASPGRWKLTLKGEFGSFCSEIESADFRDGSTLLLAFDPLKPYFVPARQARPSPVTATLERGDQRMELLVSPTGFSAMLNLAGQDYLLALMRIMDPEELAEKPIDDDA